MKKVLGSLLGIGFLSLFVNIAQAQSAEQILKKADDFRNPGESFEMQVQVETSESNSTFVVYLKGNEQTIIVTKQPARDVGRNMLMLDRDFYAYIPNLKRSMRLSLSQKLSGQVANGDVSRTRWYGDYEATIEKKSEGKIWLFLKGKKPNLTYDSMRIVVDAKTSKPLAADFLGLDGKKVLKRAAFEDYKTLAGAERPGTIRILDPSTNETSFIRVQSMKVRNFTEGFFTQRNMESLR